MFTYSPIDRHAQIRQDLSLVNESLQSHSSRVLIWFDGKFVTREDNSLFFLYEEIKTLTDHFSEFIYLGRHCQLGYFCCELKQWHGYFDNLELLGLRQASLTMDDFQLGLLYHSQGIINWHKNHPYCSGCGSATRMTHSGHVRKCNNSDCNRSHYPKIDPAVIFSVINNSALQSKILLARQAVWDKYRHSVIAGFVEPGETLEDTVKREAYEETGLDVNNIIYAGSQPWPFPGQIMLGFSSETDQWDIELMDNELEQASWFSATDIEQKVKSGKLKMPFQASISWQLINTWFKQQTGYELYCVLKEL